MNLENENELKNFIKPNVTASEKDGDSSRNERREAKESEIIAEERKLRILSEALGDAEYYIGGGVGTELAEGAIKYRHWDIDIIVFEDELDRIKEKLKSKGFTITQGRGWGGHSLDAINFEISEESDLPHGKDAVHIGIFIYKRNEEKGMAQQLDEDGDVAKEFPLKYFNREKQSIYYKGSMLTIADLRISAGFKIASDRPKDIKDTERIRSLLKSRYSKQEIEELKKVSKNNIETLFMASIKHTFSNFLETKRQITSENIYDYFGKEFKERIAELEDIDFADTIKEFIGGLKEFSPTTEDPKKIKKEFSVFAANKLKPTINYYKNIVDKTLG